jgi:hypothetical protein
MPMTEIENVLQPGKTYRVDSAKYQAMREAYLRVLPADGPGMTPSALLALLVPQLPATVFPGGEKAGWWAKAVQLDLEAKGVVRRSPSSPVRLWRA